jgi:hypothetical protein
VSLRRPNPPRFAADSAAPRPDLTRALADFRSQEPASQPAMKGAKSKGAAKAKTKEVVSSSFSPLY